MSSDEPHGYDFNDIVNSFGGFDEFYSWFRQIVCPRTSSSVLRQDRDDVISSTLLRLRQQTVYSLDRAYLHRVVVHQHLKELQKYWGLKRRDSLNIDPTELDEPRQADDDSPDRLAAKNELIKLVLQAVEQLSSDEREVLELHVVEKCSFREIESKLGIRRSTAADRYHRAIGALKRSLGADSSGADW